MISRCFLVSFFLHQQHIKNEKHSSMHDYFAYIHGIQFIILGFSDALPSLRMVSKIHLDLIESSVKAHGYLEVVRIII